METKKINIEGLEGKTLEVATAFNALVDSYVELEKKAVNPDEVKALKDKIEALEKVEVKSYDNEIKTLKDALTALEEKQNKPSGQMEHKSMAQAIVDLFEEKGIKSVLEAKKYLGKELELKADNQFVTTSVTGTVGRTQDVGTVMFPRLRPTAFIGQQGIRVGTVESGKSVLLWTPGAYTSNAGYVGEFSLIANGQAASAQEKTRKMAKLGAFQVLSQETFEDLPQFAQRLQGKLMEAITLKFDELILSGLGNDTTKPTEVYGLKTGQMTAFDYTKVDSVVLPNVADLVDACSTQAELDQYKTSVVWMNPKTANKLRRTKDTTGQYVINQLITGELVLGGHRVITNTGIGATELIVADPAAIQIWYKRNFTMKFEDKPDYDAVAMYVYLRAQVLVEDEDIKGIIYVADIDTELDNLTSAS